MRVLFLLLAPLLAHSQLDTTITYKTKEVSSIVVMGDSTVSWKTDTIPYDLLFEIKFTSTKIAIDGYGSYKIVKHELHGVDSSPGYHYFELSNKTKLTWVESAVIWEFPVVNKKSKLIVFQIE